MFAISRFFFFSFRFDLRLATALRCDENKRNEAAANKHVKLENVPALIRDAFGLLFALPFQQNEIPKMIFLFIRNVCIDPIERMCQSNCDNVHRTMALFHSVSFVHFRSVKSVCLGSHEIFSFFFVCTICFINWMNGKRFISRWVGRRFD